MHIAIQLLPCVEDQGIPSEHSSDLCSPDHFSCLEVQNMCLALGTVKKVEYVNWSPSFEAKQKLLHLMPILVHLSIPY